MAKSKFSRIRCKMGTDYLRQYLTMILARKMKQMMPGLKDGCVDDLQRINEDLLSLGYANDENVDYDDLISELVEKTMTLKQSKLTYRKEFLDGTSSKNILLVSSGVNLVTCF